MSEPKKLNPIGVRLEPDVRAELERMAAADSRKLASYIALVLKRHVEAAKSGKPAGKGKG